MDQFILKYLLFSLFEPTKKEKELYIYIYIYIYIYEGYSINMGKFKKMIILAELFSINLNPALFGIVEAKIILT